MSTLRIAIAGALLVAASAGAQDSGIPVGDAAPGAKLQSLVEKDPAKPKEPKQVDLASFVGKGPVLLEFWAAWCENCKELEPTLLALHTKYGKQVKFISVAVSVNQPMALAKRYVDAHKLPWETFYDWKGNASGAYDAPATSYVVLVDRSGKVAYTNVGGKQPQLEAAIKKVLAP